MNPAIAALAGLFFNKLRQSSGKLTMNTVDVWIRDHCDREHYGAGYSGGKLARGPSNGYVEVLKRAEGNSFEVTATAYLDPRQGPVASKTWKTSKLDSGLEKFFGRNLRVRVKI
jgi:hypothetical protein